MLLYLLAFVPVIILIIIFAFVVRTGQDEKAKNMSLKKAYLYIVSIIALVIAMIGAITLLNMALKTWVFPKADQNYYSYPACPVSPDPKATSTCDQVAMDQQKQLDQENQAAQKQRDAAQALAMLIVATPVWYYHWKMARKEA